MAQALLILRLIMMKMKAKQIVMIYLDLFEIVKIYVNIKIAT